MANTSVAITPGSGANIAVNAAGGLDFQVVKLDLGADGVSLPAVADGSGNLMVNLGAITGGVTFTAVQGTAANLKVDASGATVPISAASAIPISALATAPAFVRISNGSAAVDTLPVSGTVAATQSGVWAAKLTDGTNNAHLTLEGSNYALDVNIVSSIALGGTSVADGATFTAGTTLGTPISGVFNDSIAAVSSGKAGGVRITADRALHFNPRDSSGNEIGTAANPIFTSPATSPNPQPVSGSVTAIQGTPGASAWLLDLNKVGGVSTAIAGSGTGIQKVGVVDGSGTAFSETNPLFTAPSGKARTRVTKSVAVASGTGVTVWTPTSGKAFYITKVVFIVIASDTFDLFDNTDSAPNLVASGTMVAASYFTLDFGASPWASSAVNNVLKYTAGSALTGTLTVHGYEE